MVTVCSRATGILLPAEGPDLTSKMMAKMRPYSRNISAFGRFEKAQNLTVCLPTQSRKGGRLGEPLATHSFSDHEVPAVGYSEGVHKLIELAVIERHDATVTAMRPTTVNEEATAPHHVYALGNQFGGEAQVPIHGRVFDCVGAGRERATVQRGQPACSRFSVLPCRDY